jgi:hypothetical protein
MTVLAGRKLLHCAQVRKRGLSTPYARSLTWRIRTINSTLPTGLGYVAAEHGRSQRLSPAIRWIRYGHPCEIWDTYRISNRRLVGHVIREDIGLIGFRLYIVYDTRSIGDGTVQEAVQGLLPGRLGRVISIGVSAALRHSRYVVLPQAISPARVG